MPDNIDLKNRKASFEYDLISKYTAGIILTGSEIKSIRNSNVNMSDSHCISINNELFIKNLYIGEYKNSLTNHETKRDRKLLLNRTELNKIINKTKEKGMTVIPTRLFINKKGKAKIEIALAKGRKIHDKRERLKQKDIMRDIERETLK